MRRRCKWKKRVLIDAAAAAIVADAAATDPVPAEEKRAYMIITSRRGLFKRLLSFSEFFIHFFRVKYMYRFLYRILPFCERVTGSRRKSHFSN